MLVGTAETTVATPPAAAFAFLADPRNAGLWFAGAGFAVPPEGPPRAGLTWSFARTPGTRRVVPTHMSVYEPPAHFVWESRLSRLYTNHTWEVRCEPGGAEAPGGTRLVMTIRLRPGLLDLPSVAAGFVLVRRALRDRAGRAVERAREALERLPRDDDSGPGGRRRKRGHRR